MKTLILAVAMMVAMVGCTDERVGGRESALGEADGVVDTTGELALGLSMGSCLHRADPSNVDAIGGCVEPAAIGLLAGTDENTPIPVEAGLACLADLGGAVSQTCTDLASSGAVVDRQFDGIECRPYGNGIDCCFKYCYRWPPWADKQCFLDRCFIISRHN